MSEADLLLKLQKSLDAACQDLAKVSSKKMFGCHAVWVNDQVFGLVWKHGRIGFRLPDGDAFAELMAIKGSEPWTAGTRTMSHWVLVPESYHTKAASLKTWAQQAYDLGKTATKKTETKKNPAIPKTVSKTTKPVKTKAKPKKAK